MKPISTCTAHCWEILIFFTNAKFVWLSRMKVDFVISMTLTPAQLQSLTLSAWPMASSQIQALNALAATFWTSSRC